jgi:hypothetical protein
VSSTGRVVAQDETKKLKAASQKPNNTFQYHARLGSMNSETDIHNTLKSKMSLGEI